MRSVLRKFTAMAVVSALAGAGVLACSSDIKKNTDGQSAEEKQGKVGLKLQLVDGVDIDVVTWTVNQGATIIDTGDLPVDGPGTDFAFGVPLPVGNGYVLSLEATSTSGDVTCTGGYPDPSAIPPTFDILPNTSQAFTLTLTCTNVATGELVGSVNVETDSCPELNFEYAVTTPFSAPLPDGSVRVRALAVDDDGGAVTYAWSAPGTTGTFDAPTLGDTRFNCDEFGVHTLTVTADNTECTKSLTTIVSCFNVSCGNGVPDVGETCDPNDPSDPLAAVCPADCTFSCGDNNAEANEACDFDPSFLPAGTDTCTGTCQIRTPSCGDGFVTAPETCDPAVPGSEPVGGSCDASCQDVGVAACGNGLVESGETCDPVGGNPYTANNCGGVWGIAGQDQNGGADNDCNIVSSASCDACVDASGGCGPLSTWDCDQFGSAVGSSGLPLANLCREQLDCMRDTNCGVVQVLDCYCGSANPSQCAGGLGNGECRATMEKTLETTDPGTLILRTLNASFGGGLADNRVDCETFECKAAPNAGTCFQ